MQTECTDIHCPKHAGLATHGAKLEAVVVSDKMKRSVVVEREYPFYVPKYERYERRTTRIQAHNPDCIKAKIGDRVLLRGCRPISKLKSFVIIEKIGGK
ncbi:TPA: 30S ribosomal protein S17 [archaeon]|uniref:30S ribosomal protein S17 n=1 Tax=Candidatus Naiadarchaeum limnaeum TaxID=2756139 RepID=A0A832UVI6_9ARCH|nr:30S ribosomal protein S17 [Candidatus Naiadarchaeales archaeon SRR2090153.bin1042]HIK00490.1 30S ribosomal protein S17 [Candidatus Naiadarchaeum limnaeum]